MKQQKIAHVLCHKDGETAGPKLEIFPSEQWKKPRAKVGYYRLRKDRLWVMQGEKYTFMPPSKIGEIVVQSLGLVEPEPENVPELRPQQRVTVLGPNGWTMGITVTDPIQGPDGQWQIWVRGYGFAGFYLCEEIRR